MVDDRDVSRHELFGEKGVYSSANSRSTSEAIELTVLQDRTVRKVDAATFVSHDDDGAAEGDVATEPYIAL